MYPAGVAPVKLQEGRDKVGEIEAKMGKTAEYWVVGKKNKKTQHRLWHQTERGTYTAVGHIKVNGSRGKAFLGPGGYQILKADALGCFSSAVDAIKAIGEWQNRMTKEKQPRNDSTAAARKAKKQGPEGPSWTRTSQSTGVGRSTAKKQRPVLAPVPLIKKEKSD